LCFTLLAPPASFAYAQYDVWLPIPATGSLETLTLNYQGIRGSHKVGKSIDLPLQNKLPFAYQLERSFVINKRRIYPLLFFSKQHLL
jgi:hypothetical protein